MTIDRELFLKNLAAFGLTLDERAVGRFDRYAALLIGYNEKVNLTAITAPEEIALKHFVDSLALLSFVDLPEGARVADVGTGAGFPGMALLVARPDLRVTLFDSVNKKLDFLRFLSGELGLSPEIVHIRAEDAGHDPAYRETFDLVTARAVASLDRLSEYCVPLVKRGGLFVPMKAPLTEEERENGLRAAGKLGAKLKEGKSYVLPGGDGREVLVFEKRSLTPSNYPRPAAKIAKSPLK